MKSQLFIRHSQQLGRAFEHVLSKLSPLNITDKLSELEMQIDNISIEVNQRQKLMDVELGAIKQLADILDEPCPTSDSDIFSGPEGTPELSDLRLSLMKQCRLDLERVRDDRMNKMIKILSESQQNVKDMILDEEGFHTLETGHEYPSEYHKQFDQKLSHYYRTGEFLFQVRKLDIAYLQERMAKVAAEKEARRTQLAVTGAEIAKLWTLLRVSSHEREAFQV